MRPIPYDDAEVCRLYVEEGLSTKAIGVLLGHSEGVVRRRLIAAGIERRPSAQARFARRDFGGDPLERAYLLGFRLGDLHVAPTQFSVVVKCTSTRPEQLELFRRLFGPYGHVYSDEATREGRVRQSVGMQVFLNRSFEFLLPKEDRVPEWVLAEDEAFFAYFAGYLDAEGYVKAIPSDLRVELRSYDRNVLRQFGEGLNERGITCPPASLCVAAGYTNRYGVRSNEDLWRLGIGRMDALHRLFTRIDPYVRHARRRRDMERAWATVTSKLSDPSVVRRLWAISGREVTPVRRE
jgi:LAGLIDADG-like domain